jgi:hypothetical protein
MTNLSLIWNRVFNFKIHPTPIFILESLKCIRSIFPQIYSEVIKIIRYEDSLTGFLQLIFLALELLFPERDFQFSAQKPECLANPQSRLIRADYRRLGLSKGLS